MNITIAVAHHLELNPFLEKFGEYEPHDTGQEKVYLLQIGTIPIQVVRTGIGMANAQQSLAHALEQKNMPWSGSAPDVLVNFGTSGAIHPDRKIGEVVVGSHSVSDESGEVQFDLRSVWGDRFIEYLQTRNIEFAAGTIFSTEKAVTSPDGRRSIYQRTNAQVVDMECAGLAKVAQQQKVPFIPVKYVSDNADEFAIKDFFMNVEEGVRVLTSIIYEFIEFVQPGNEPN